MKDGKRRRSKKAKAAAPPAAVDRVLAKANGFILGSSARGSSSPSEVARLRALLEKDYAYAGHRSYGGYVGGSEYHQYTPRPTHRPQAVQGDNIRTLYHGTSVWCLEGILKNGLRPSWTGLLGPGIYLGGRDKAENYFRDPDAGVLLVCRVNLGKVFEARPSACGVPLGCDSVRGVPGVTQVTGGTLLREEFIVRDKSQIEIVAIWLYKGREHECSRCGKVYFESRLTTDQALWLCKSCAIRKAPRLQLG